MDFVLGKGELMLYVCHVFTRSLSEAWQKFGDNIENESEIHR